MDADFADVPGFLESEIGPRFARIGGFVNAVSVGNVNPDGAFSHARIDHIGVRRRHLKGADRRTAEEAVRDVLPVSAAVLGFPNTACRRTKIKHL